MEQMESRSCACGCGTTFRVMVASNQRYASMAHEAPLVEGGFTTLMQRNRKKNGFKVIPPDRHGIVGSQELADILGCSYQTIYNRMKAGHLSPIPQASGRTQWDLDEVRKQLGQPSEPMPVARHKQNTKPQEEPMTNELETQMEETTATVEPDAPATSPRRRRKVKAEPPQHSAFDVIHGAFSAAKNAFRKHVRNAAAVAHESGDTDSELALLRMYAHCGPVFDAVKSELTTAGTH